MPHLKLSLCMVVKNEERQLARCLDSARALVDEIVVVDTGSTDATPAIAAQYGARVRPFDFSYVDFSAARNHGLAQATGDWILVLDADEALDVTTAPLVWRCMSSNLNIGYFLQRRNYSAGTRPVTTDHVLRLFVNRPEHRYCGRVHETVDASILRAGGRLGTTGIVLHHLFAQDEEARRRKNQSYIRVLEEELAANPSDDTRLDFLAAEYHQLGRLDQALETAERIARARPNDPQAHLNVGIYHLLQKHDGALARAAFEKALQLRPQYPEALSFLRTLEARERVQGRLSSEAGWSPTDGLVTGAITS